MRDEAISLTQGIPDPARRLHVLREYLQELVLRSLHESEAFTCLSFVGGTAARLLFGLPRFSEDLDFSLESSAGYEPVRWVEKVKRDLGLAGFDAAVSWNDRKTVHVAWVKIGGILRDAGLAAMAQQKLSIKLEIDTRPPPGALTAAQVVTGHVMFAVRHHDLPSLMAGKLHALITRKYAKGRDWYDLLWYRGRRPPVEPNLALLQNALDQTEGPGALEARRWAHHVLDRVGRLDVVKLKADVEPFLKRPGDAGLITAEHLRAAAARKAERA
ncbi:MAG: nucleotidyl transferase AbiEii/AbiGii toxin family protein [Planctomycetes bacterium]|nr:nucleotidyl transferase AbiEii/AbiGii toxin family protein [Planctomycetota bacterium]